MSHQNDLPSHIHHDEERRFKGVLADNYASIRSWLPEYDALQDAVAQEVVRAHPSPSVIDVGVGTGVTMKAILDAYPHARVTGIDHDASMLVQAQMLLEDQIKNGSATLIESDIVDFFATIPDASVDVIVSALTLHNCWTSYRHLAEAEFFRALKSGGVFINADKYAADDDSEYRQQIVRAMTSFDPVISTGNVELRKALIDHEIADQHPDRIMRTERERDYLGNLGFKRVELMKGFGQYSVLTAFKD